MQIAVIWTLTLLTGVSAQAQPQRSNQGLKQSREYVDRQVIVKLKDNAPATEADALRNSVRASVLKRFPSIGAELWQLSGGTVEQAMVRYRQDPRIEYIEPNYKVSLIRERIERIPNDPRFPQMWGLNNTGQTGGTPDADIDAPEAWDIETGNNVIVGVIDTGVDWQHEDLAANIWTNPGEIPNNNIDDDNNGYVDDIRGWDFVNNDNNPMDDNGHGSHVSGTIAAVGNNGIGTVGVSWSAKIMGLKFLNSGGNGTDADAISAIEYATRNGARLTSNSWGSFGNFSQSLYDAIAAAGRAGILFVAAAGNSPIDNDTNPNPNYPSSYDLDNIIAVAATDHNDRKADFSAWGATSVDLGAPGVNILSTFPNNTYGTISGTSMATPHVSGAVSLIWSRVPGLPHLKVKDILLQTVDPVPDLQNRFPTVSGGRLNAFKALILAEPDSIPPAPVTDVAATDPKSNFITLTWTASGDDGDSGKAAAYDIRYSTAPINANNFAQATRVFGAPLPQPAGSQETFTVGGLDFNTTYFFALKVIDEQGNASEVSNSPSNTTLGIPIIAVTPDSLADTLLTGAKSNHTLFISNEGEGTLDFEIAITGADTLAVSAQINSFALNRARQKSGEAEQQESHQAQYEAYNNGASAGLSSPAQPVANPNLLALYRRFLRRLPIAVIFHDDMESGENGWSHYSTHANRIDQWAQTKNRANSGATAGRSPNIISKAASAAISAHRLNRYDDATLAFMHWHNFDDCNDPTFDPDGGILEVSSDGGARWTQIFPSAVILTFG
jgi:subtilisin family serine protease